MTLDERLLRYWARQPRIPASVWIAPGAAVFGDAEIGENSSVWFNAVVRADFNRIVVGRQTNIQDCSVLHVSDEFPCLIGNCVTVGHGARVHACTVEDGALIGMGSTVLDGATVGAEALVGANSLVPMGMKVPPGWLVVGSPATLVRELQPEEKALIRSYADKYVHTAKAYMQRRDNAPSG